MTSCPQAILQVTIEADGKQQKGYSGDCLPPGWFDKSPNKNYQQQIEEMLAVTALAEKVFLDELGQPTHFFPGWKAAYERVQREAVAQQWEPLLASFGISMVERAVLDAMARAANLPFSTAIRQNLYGLRPGEIHGELAGLEPKDWLPPQPAHVIHVRHTVGLIDPLTAQDVSADEQLHDGFPHTLEDYLTQTGIRYFKIKISNDLDHNMDRLATIGDLLNRHCGQDYHVTLDGNEQFTRAEEFIGLLEAISSNAVTAQLLAATIAIEQPLERHISLSADHDAVHEMCQWKRVIIDESDGTLDAYPKAMKLGYRGVSSKNCKGPIKSILNAGLTWYHNEQGSRRHFLITGEDLCTVGIVPVQSDLCLVATLGLTHVERNGHHYHPGLSYLPMAEQRAALAAHADLYAQQQGVIAPRLINGTFEIGSLQCVGFGFAVEPEMASMQPPEEWEYASLGL